MRLRKKKNVNIKSKQMVTGECKIVLKIKDYELELFINNYEYFFMF